MSHIFQVVHTVNLYHMRFVVNKIVVRLDSCGYFIEIISFFHFDINHTAMNACSHRDCHRQSRLYTFDGFNGNGMSHAHARSEVCICNSFRNDCLQQSTHDRVASRIPSGRDYGHRIMSFSNCIERTAQIDNTSVDIETIHRIDA